MKSKIFLSLICFAALSLGVHAAETAGSTPASNRPKITDNSSASAEATSSKQQNTDAITGSAQTALNGRVTTVQQETTVLKTPQI